MFGRNKQRREEGAEKSSGEKDYFAQSNDWEASRIHAVERSERRAWFVAGTAVVAVIALGVAIAAMMPLKEKVPYLVRENAHTGAPDVLTALDESGVGYDEVRDKYWLAQYVIARETYDWYTLQKDYDTVGLLSSSNVAKAYGVLFEGDNALDKKFGSQVRVTVKVVSVVPNGSGIGTVRFSKTSKRVDDAGQGQTTYWIATLGYEYRNPSVMRESDRLINPFAFSVTSYRADPEMGVAQ